MSECMFERVKREVGKALFASGLFDGYAYPQVEGAIEAAARAAIKAGADEPDNVELVYGYLVTRVTQAARAEDRPLVHRLMDALTVFEELWPEQSARFQQRHSQPAPTTDDPPSVR